MVNNIGNEARTINKRVVGSKKDIKKVFGSREGRVSWDSPGGNPGSRYNDERGCPQSSLAGPYPSLPWLCGDIDMAGKRVFVCVQHRTGIASPSRLS